MYVALGAFLTSKSPLRMAQRKTRKPQEIQDIEARQAKYMLEAMAWDEVSQGKF
jgi:hypothetical protein